MRELKKQFRLAIKCGLGSTYFIMHNNPAIDFSYDIIKASLSNLAYDGQCEGDRAIYISRLIDLCKKKESIVNRILTALAAEKSDTWALDQLFELAAIFALEGNKKAKRAVYERFSKEIIQGSPWCGQDAIIKMDGISGLLFIAETRGKTLSKNREEWEDSFLVDEFQKNNPDIKVYAELGKAATKNAFVKKYLAVIKTNKWTKKESSQRIKYNYSMVKDNIEKMKPIPVPLSAVKDLTLEDLKNLAEDFRQESNLEKREKYLKVFARIKYPYDYKVFLNIVQNEKKHKNRVVELACEALGHFQASEIRKLAIKKLQETFNPSVYLPLLVSNYKKNDFTLMEEIISRHTDFDVIHSLAWSFIEIYSKNKTKECKEPLEKMYGKLNCGMHRYDIIKILHENNVLSEQILKEIEYDSYESIREFYHKIIKEKR